MAHLFQSISVESSLSVEHHIARLALEADVLSNAADALSNIIPKISDNIKNFLNSFSSGETPAEQMIRRAEKDVSAIKSVIPYSSFATFDRTLVTVPEGFYGTFENYLDALHSMTREINVNATDVLSTLQADLSMFISSRENKFSNKDKTAVFKKFEKRREDIQKELGSFFTDKNVRSKAYMSEVIGRFEDIDTITNKCRRLTEMNTGKVLDEIHRHAKEVNELLEIVIADSREDGASKVSGASAKNIAAGAYEAAKAVELVGIFRFRIEQIAAVIKDLVEQLKKILKDKH